MAGITTRTLLLVVVGITLAGSYVAISRSEARGRMADAEQAIAKDICVSAIGSTGDAPAGLRLSHRRVVVGKAGLVAMLTIGDLHAPREVIDYQMHKDDAFDFVVTSRQSGTITAHGLTNDVVVIANVPANLRGKAQYTGRFPLHFHSADGVHNEMAWLSVYPSD